MSLTGQSGSFTSMRMWLVLRAALGLLTVYILFVGF